MNDTHRVISWQTPKGSIIIRSFCTPREIRVLNFDKQFGTHAHYKSLYTKRESLEKNAALPDANVTLAVAEQNHIIGFGVLAYPDEGERWTKLGPHVMMEVRAIEVCRKWRSGGVASGILTKILDAPMIEDKIVYMVGYSWTWDLEGTNKSALEYRKMLIKLFEPHGFREYQTNEANICLKPENILLGRIGNNVSKKQQDSFKWLRFGVFDDSKEFLET